MNTTTQYTLAELIHGLDVELKGDPECVINGVSPIQQSQSGHISFLTNAAYKKYLSSTLASAVILHPKDLDAYKGNAILSANPHFTYAKIAAYFYKPVTRLGGIHPNASISAQSEIDASAEIGPHCYIGQHVKIAAGVIIGAGTVIEDYCEIGEATQLDANVTLYHHTKIGKRSHLSSGVVVGSDGFGFANQRGVWHKVPQLGGVRIGDDVDIGANTTIDRGALEDTIIESGVKLDNLIQVGHNVKIGENTLICGCVAIAGSTIIGRNCMIGGAVCFAGHLTVCDGAMITGMTAVTKSIREPGVYSSGIVGAIPNQEFRKNNARFHRLGHLIERVQALESALKALTERS
jgi:UDP-3-O-[3-hydroxymyristoyl] glucosamine N-acyltransferase